MRIILWLAAAGAAAIGTAVAARPAGMSSGQGGGFQIGWSNGGGHRAGKGVHTRFGPGAIRSDRRHGRHHGRSDRQVFQPYRTVGIDGPVGAADPFGNGFFTGGGGRISLRGGRPYYDYDRGYPYEWTPAAGGRLEWEEETRTTGHPARCTMENGVRVCRGW